MWLRKPVLQDVLEVNALPVARSRIELDLERADPDVPAALVSDRLESEDLKVNCGGLLQGPQVHPQLGFQNLGEHQLRTELEKTATGLPVHLHYWFRCGEMKRTWYFSHSVMPRCGICLKVSRHSFLLMYSAATTADATCIISIEKHWY